MIIKALSLRAVDRASSQGTGREAGPGHVHLPGTASAANRDGGINQLERPRHGVPCNDDVIRGFLNLCS